MPRPTRIQYEHAFYHVMNRGRGRQTIFHGDDYYHAFLKTLDEAHERFDARIHAYCLMGNHYHLLIETPQANLDRIMRHINGVYTQRYNRLKRTDGPLFRGRYKAILVDGDAYLLQLGRYIHRNPLEVNGAAPDALSSYPWSSYLAYLGKAKPPSWLEREATYRMLGHRHRYAGYRLYVEAGSDEALLEFYKKGKQAAVLGDQQFRETVARFELSTGDREELVATLSRRPDARSIVKAVARTFKVTETEIVKRRTGRQSANLPRKVAIYCCQRFAGLTLKEIATVFNFSHPGSVSPAVAAVSEQLENGRLTEQMDVIEEVLNVIK